MGGRWSGGVGGMGAQCAEWGRGRSGWCWRRERGKNGGRAAWVWVARERGKNGELGRGGRK
ncbi:hypothetical protein TIFTF001_030433 [Ficus carica]|uniref:Uncharacterized protein n=1 Tax=Ficus carica TaxID=3494 RepID=A0AA88DTG7_FICCA|nr:hypothetical protein TIFTF001_030433 [Ficus carica]